MRRWVTNTDKPVIILTPRQPTQDFNAKAYWAGGAVSSGPGVDGILPDPAAYPIGVINEEQRHALLVVNGEVGEPEPTEQMSVEQLKQARCAGIFQTGPHFAILNVERPPFAGF